VKSSRRTVKLTVITSLIFRSATACIFHGNVIREPEISIVNEQGTDRRVADAHTDKSEEVKMVIIVSAASR
jgi:hypothetical protein